MKLADMKLSKKKKAETETAQPSSSVPDYPYGLSLTLNEDSLKKLGMDELPKVGETCMIHAAGEITRVSQSSSNDGKEKSVEIQITKLHVMPGMDEDSEYRDAAEKGFAAADKD